MKQWAYQVGAGPVEHATLGLNHLPFQLVFMSVLVELAVEDRLESFVDEVERLVGSSKVLVRPLGQGGQGVALPAGQGRGSNGR